jgi:hypothetical protein
MTTYLVEVGNEHALSMVKKIQAAEHNAYVICTRGELAAFHDGSVVTLPDRTGIKGEDK